MSRPWHVDEQSHLHNCFQEQQLLVLPCDSSDEVMQLHLIDIQEHPERPDYVEEGGVRWYIALTGEMSEDEVIVPPLLFAYTLHVPRHTIYMLCVCEAAGRVDEDGHIDLGAMRQVIARTLARVGSIF